MKTLQQKRLELLDETANHYNINNRCAGKIKELYSCRYHPKSLGLEGKTEGCAIGRKVGRSLALKLDLKGGDAEEIFNLLPKKLQELGDEFLMELQNLHDKKANWNKKGLNREGRKEYTSIKKKFC